MKQNILDCKDTNYFRKKTKNCTSILAALFKDAN